MSTSLRVWLASTLASMNLGPATSTVSPELLTQARHRAAGWLKACPQEVLSQFASPYRLAQQVQDSAHEVLALTMYALAATTGRTADEVTPAEIRQTLIGRGTPAALMDFWRESLRVGNLPPAAWRALAFAINWASRSRWDDSLSINGPGIAPFPASDGPPVALAVLEQLAPPV